MTAVVDDHLMLIFLLLFYFYQMIDCFSLIEVLRVDLVQAFYQDGEDYEDGECRDEVISIGLRFHSIIV